MKTKMMYKDKTNFCIINVCICCVSSIRYRNNDYSLSLQYTFNFFINHVLTFNGST